MTAGGRSRSSKGDESAKSVAPRSCGLVDGVRAAAEMAARERCSDVDCKNARELMGLLVAWLSLIFHVRKVLRGRRCRPLSMWLCAIFARRCWWPSCSAQAHRQRRCCLGRCYRPFCRVCAPRVLYGLGESISVGWFSSETMRGVVASGAHRCSDVGWELRAISSAAARLVALDVASPPGWIASLKVFVGRLLVRDGFVMQLYGVVSLHLETGQSRALSRNA